MLQAPCAHVFVFNISHWWWCECLAYITLICAHLIQLTAFQVVLFISLVSEWANERTHEKRNEEETAAAAEKAARTQLAIDKNSQCINKSFSCSFDCFFFTCCCSPILGVWSIQRVSISIWNYWFNEFIVGIVSVLSHGNSHDIYLFVKNFFCVMPASSPIEWSFVKQITCTNKDRGIEKAKKKYPTQYLPLLLFLLHIFNLKSNTCRRMGKGYRL